MPSEEAPARGLPTLKPLMLVTPPITNWMQPHTGELPMVTTATKASSDGDLWWSPKRPRVLATDPNYDSFQTLFGACKAASEQAEEPWELLSVSDTFFCNIDMAFINPFPLDNFCAK